MLGDDGLGAAFVEIGDIVLQRFDTVGVPPSLKDWFFDALIAPKMYKWRRLIDNFLCELKEFK